MQTFHNITVQEEVVIQISDEVVTYLRKYPEECVTCTIMKVILDNKSFFSNESIFKIARKIPSLDERIDQVDFITSMFNEREKLVDRVNKHVVQGLDKHDDPPKSDIKKQIDYNSLLSNISRILRTLSDLFNVFTSNG